MRVALACLLFTAPAFAGTFSWADVEIPRVRAHVPVHGKLEAAGVPVSAHQVVTEAPVEELLRLFMGAFHKAKLFVPPARDQAKVRGGIALTALDPDRMVSFTVLLTPNGDGTTTVTLGEASLGERKQTHPQAIAPTVPDARDVVVVDVEAARTMSYRTALPPQEIAAFYEKTLGGAGFREVEPGLYRTRHREIAITVKPLDAKTRAVLVVARTRPAQ